VARRRSTLLAISAVPSRISDARRPGQASVADRPAAAATVELTLIATFAAVREVDQA